MQPASLTASAPHSSFTALDRFAPTIRRIVAVMLLGIAIALSTSSLPARSVPFANAAFPTSIVDPTAVEAADLDEDGEPDLVVTGSGGTLHWLQWTGTGYTAHELSTTLSLPSDLAVDDFDCDGLLDIAVADTGAGSVELFLQSPVGVWAATTAPSTAVAGITRLVAADMDRDGTTDLALVQPASDTVLILRNTSCDASGWPAVTVTSAADGVADLAAADIDSDGFLDLVLAATDANEVLLSLSNGNGTFTTSTLGALTDVEQLAIADLDQDGVPDVVAASATLTRWFVNDGSWTADDLDDPQALGAGSLTLGDLEGDGDIDVVVTVSTSQRGATGSIGWWENDDGFTYHEIEGGLDQPEGNALLDRGRDGDLDVALIDPSNDEATTFENLAIGRSARFPDEFFLPTPYGFIDLVDLDLGDVDGDGDLDLIATDSDVFTAIGYVFWLENAQDGSTDFLQIGSPQALAFSQTAATFESTVVGDFDGDGKLDVVVGADNNVAISASFCPHPASLSTWWTCYSISSGTYETISPEAAGDIDGDGDLDLVVEAVEAGTGVRNIQWWELDGDPTVSSDWTIHTIDTPALLRQLNLADLDGDHDLDVLTSSTVWWRNDGGDPIVWSEEPVADLFGRPAAGDIDGDGDLDLVAVHIDLLGGPTISWFENQLPATTWSYHVIWEADDASGPVDIGGIADVDGDGDLDVVSGTAGTTSQLAWYENDPENVFDPWPEHPLPFADFTPGHVALADFDHDGDVDVIAEPAAVNSLNGWTNGAGQFSVAGAPAAGEATPGTDAAVLSIDASHLGRTGDLEVEWRSCTLRFENGSGVPLSQPEFDELVTGIELWLDDGNGDFDSGDTLVGNWTPVVLDAAGEFELTLAAGDANATLDAAQTRVYFVTLALSATADLASNESFDVLLDPMTCSAVDAQDEFDLRGQWHPPTSVTVTPAHPIFSDGFESGDTSAWL